MEDGDTGNCIDSDGCADGNGNDELHGTGTCHILAFRAGQKKETQAVKTTAWVFLLSGLLDSNQRPRAPQTCALPTALNPDPFAFKRVQRYEVFLKRANF